MTSPRPAPPIELLPNDVRWTCPRGWVAAGTFSSPEPTALWGQRRVLEALDLLALEDEGRPVGLDLVSPGYPGEARAVADALAARLPGRVELLATPSDLALRGRGAPGLLADPGVDAVVLDVGSLVGNETSWTPLREALLHGSVSEAPTKDETFTPSHRARARVVLVGRDPDRKRLREKTTSLDACLAERVAFTPDLPRDRGGVAVVASRLRAEAEARGLGDLSDGALAFLVEQNAGRPARRNRVAVRTDRLLRAILGARRHEPEGPLSVRAVRQGWRELAWRGDVQETGHRARVRERQLAVVTNGTRRGVVNGLMVYGSGDTSYCIPGRITARVSVGREGVINIERESKYSGRSFDKGVFQLAAWLRGTFAGSTHPLGVAASVAFEQSYGKVDGDSATLAETLAILSELAELPVRQDVAVTGAITQKGELLPIGSVNLKVRGWWESCRAHGPLTGAQGVLIPSVSAADLQIDREVLADVRAGRFHVWTAGRIEDAAELLLATASGAGSPRPSAQTVLGRAARTLRRMSERLYPPRKTPANPAQPTSKKAANPTTPSVKES